ncbi:MAG TPA: glycosyltransferase [Ferruginibacter sp.]|nr:glycosyltransferase [Ferruginibacter sp.]
MPEPSVTVIGNIPKRPVLQVQASTKQSGRLNLIYLSLITAKKNLLLLLEWLLLAPAGVHLDIYGPVKDVAYWNACEAIIRKHPDRFQYKGDVIPDQVQHTFQQYDAFAFLTQGENFGHALYECLSAGRPILTSRFTPWNDLEKAGAGWNVDLNDRTIFLDLITQLIAEDAVAFNRYNQAALERANLYYRNEVDAPAYERLFAS